MTNKCNTWSLIGSYRKEVTKEGEKWNKEVVEDEEEKEEEKRRKLKYLKTLKLPNLKCAIKKIHHLNGSMYSAYILFNTSQDLLFQETYLST